MMALLAGGLKKMIAANQRHGPAQRFKIITAAARRAGIETQTGMALAESVPVCQITLDVEILRHSHTIRRLSSSPESKRIHVSILPVEIDALFRQSLVNMIDEPL